MRDFIRHAKSLILKRVKLAVATTTSALIGVAKRALKNPQKGDLSVIIGLDRAISRSPYGRLRKESESADNYIAALAVGLALLVLYFTLTSRWSWPKRSNSWAIMKEFVGLSLGAIVGLSGTIIASFLLLN